MGKRKKKGKQPAEPDRSFEVNPFAALSKQDLDLSEAPPEPKPKPKPKKAKASGLPDGFTREPLVTRIEKKGRGGKTVTVFAGFQTEFELELQQLTGNLKRHLGTGGTVRGDTLELQGDHRQQAADWLRDKGFRVKGI